MSVWIFPWSQMEIAIQSALLLSEWRVAQRRFVRVRVPLVSRHYRKNRFVERVDGILYKSPEFLSCCRPANKRHFLFAQTTSRVFRVSETQYEARGDPAVITFVFLSPSLCRTNQWTRPLSVLDLMTCADSRFRISIYLIEAINRLAS